MCLKVLYQLLSHHNYVVYVHQQMQLEFTIRLAHTPRNDDEREIWTNLLIIDFVSKEYQKLTVTNDFICTDSFD